MGGGVWAAHSRSSIIGVFLPLGEDLRKNGFKALQDLQGAGVQFQSVSQ